MHYPYYPSGAVIPPYGGGLSNTIVVGGAIPGWAVSPTTQSVPSTGGSYTGYVSNRDGCGSNLPEFPDSWIHFVSYVGGGTGGFNYTVDPNPGAARTGHVSIEDFYDGIHGICTLTVIQNAACSPPFAPSTTSPSGSTTTSFVANWFFQSGASGYFLDVSSNSSFSGYIINNLAVGNTNSYYVSGLACGQTYYYRVRASNSCGSSGNSSTVPAFTNSCCSGPTTPSAYYPGTITQTSFVASWSSVPGALGYYIDVSSNSSFTSFVGGYNNYTVFATSLNVTGLSCGNTYYYRVRAYNSCSVGSYSGYIAVPTGACCVLPTNPTPLLAAYITANAFQARWTNTGATGYYIDVATDPSFSTMLYNNYGVGTTTSFNVTGLTFGQTYYYKVKAINSCGENYSTLGTTVVTTNEFLAINTYVIKAGYPSAPVAEPIDIATGSYGYSHTDFSLPGINSKLNFTRYYNTVNAGLTSSLGYGWSHSYDYYITNYSDTLWVAHHADGHTSFFIPSPTNSNIAYPLFGGMYDSLYRDPSSGLFFMKFKTGELFSFNSNNRLASVTDLNNNVTTLTYSGLLLASVRSPGGRALSFSYTGTNITSVTDSLGRSVSYGYSGNTLVSATDQNYHASAFTYDAQHKILAIITARGDTLLKNVYNSQNKVVAQTDALHQTTTITYNPLDTGYAMVAYPGGATETFYHDKYYRLIHDSDELGHTTSFKYDYNNNPDTLVDARGNITNSQYDRKGNCLFVNQPLSTTTQISYNSFSRPTAILSASAQKDSFAYDTHSNVIGIFFPDQTSRHFTYYSNGQLQTSTDRLHRLVSYFYNSFGDIDSIISPSGIRAYSHDVTGRLLSFTNEDGNTTYYRYDSVGNLMCIRYPMGDSVQYYYDEDNNRTVFIDGNGYPTVYTYDAKDRCSNILDASGSNTIIAYDQRDNMDSVISANGRSVAYAHDQHNRLASVSNAFGVHNIGYDFASNITSDTDAVGIVHTSTYDGLNRVTSRRDALGDSIRNIFDPIGRIAATTDPMGRTTSYGRTPTGLIDSVHTPLVPPTFAAYDSNQQILSVKNARGKTQYFRYDSSRRLKGYTDENNHTDSFGYDRVGNETLHVKETGTITKTYDADNRLVRIINIPGDIDTFGYDRGGHMTSAYNGNGPTTFLYDSAYRIKKYVDMYSDTVSYKYDGAGNKIRVIYPGGFIVNYAINAVNLIDTVSWSGHFITYQYDPSLRIKQINFPNGIVCKYGYDNAGRLDTQTTIKGTTIIAQSILTLNSNGEWVFEAPTGPYVKHLRESSIDNLFENNNQVHTSQGLPYSFDGAGNLHTKTDLSGLTTYSFTVDNLLTSIAGSTFSATYLYNALGDRISRTQSGVTTYYVLDYTASLVQSLMERQAGLTKAINIYGIGLLARIDSAGNILYYHFNPQHNTIALSNDSGIVTDTYTYLSSGGVWRHIGTTQQPFTFMGEYGVQKESPSLYYVRFRYFDTAVHGRFLSKDIYPPSLKTPLSLNSYAYTLGDPITLSDPSGLCEEANGAVFAGEGFFADALGFITKYIVKISSTISSEESLGISFFKNAFYSSKVEAQMNDLNDIFHSFPKEIDELAAKLGKWTLEIGKDGNWYEWLRVPAILKGRSGVIEYVKKANGEITHRLFKKDPVRTENIPAEDIPDLEAPNGLFMPGEPIVPGEPIIIDF